ncbi:MAG: PDZ domain-containing protein [Spirochaetia bacterium]|nr:PDZ domain-containing protein [Spirochaetia bacterium]
MSTLSKRTILLVLIFSVSFGLVFAEGQADMFDNTDNSSTGIIGDSAVIGDDGIDGSDGTDDESTYDFSGRMRQGRGNGNDSFSFRGGRNGELKYAAAPGVLVTDVFVDSPADNAGILRGDVIVSVEGIDVSTIQDIILAIEGYKHGENISLTLLRAEKEMNINLTLEMRVGYPLIGIMGAGAGMRNGMGNFDNSPMPRSDMPFMGENMRPGFGPGYMFEDENEDTDNNGFDMMNIPEAVIEAVISGNTALITEVVEGSPAEAAGVSANMIVIAIDGKNLESGDLSGAVLTYEIGDTVELTLADMTGLSTLSVVLGDNAGNPFLGVAYRPLVFGGQGLRMPFSMPGQQDGVFQNRPNMVIPKMNNN